MAPLLNRLISGIGGAAIGGTRRLRIPNIRGFNVTPTVSGKSVWNLDTDGVLILDGATATTYTLVAQSSFSTPVVMWGQASSTSNGGYSSGTVSFANQNTYVVKLNAGAGIAGTTIGSGGAGGVEPGGGYAGLFYSVTVNQTNAIMISGGGGGYGGGAPGGVGGGQTGGSGTNSPNSLQGSTGGGGGTQLTGGSGGPQTGGGSGFPGLALQGGMGGTGTGPFPNAPGGGGGGGGYYGGGGGGGGDDPGATSRSGSGGGGGSGYTNPIYVISGITTTYTNAPNRGTAGAAPGGPSRVVIS